MTEADVEPTTAAILDGGWGDRFASLGFYVAHPRTHPVVAEIDGTIVGTSTAIHNGSVGWIGLVFVSPSVRGHGLGRKLTDVALERLRALGCRSILLVATELGRPIYDRLGFVEVGKYLTLRGPNLADRPSDPRLRALNEHDLNAASQLDALATAEDRSSTIHALRTGWVIHDGGTVQGYAVRTPWGYGPAIASQPGYGALLVDALRAQSEEPLLHLTIPAENGAALAYLREAGFEEQSHHPRLLLGDSVPWRPAMVWSIFGFAMG